MFKVIRIIKLILIKVIFVIVENKHTEWAKSRYTVINYILYTYFWPLPHVYNKKYEKNIIVNSYN